MTVTLLFVVLAIVFFFLDAFRVASPRVSWTPLAWAMVVIAVLLIPAI